MATNAVLVKTGQQILFNDSSAYAPANLNDLELGTATDVEILLDGIAVGEARSSAKADFGAAWAPSFAIHAAFEFATEPVTGSAVNLYWAASVQSAAGTGNPGYVTGTDADYTGTPGTLAEGLKQLEHMFSFICGADATGSIQTSFLGIWTPPTRYGSLIIVNDTADIFHSDSVEMAISFTPIIPDVQAAA